MICLRLDSLFLQTLPCGASLLQWNPSESTRNSFQLSSFINMGSQILKTIENNGIALSLCPSFTGGEEKDTQNSDSGQISLSLVPGCWEKCLESSSSVLHSSGGGITERLKESSIPLII